MQLFIW